MVVNLKERRKELNMTLEDVAQPEKRKLYPYLNVKSYIIGVCTTLKSVYLYLICHQTATKNIKK